MERHFANETGGVLTVLFGLVKKEEREVRKEDDSSVHENVGTTGNAENATDEVERLRNVGEKQKASAYAEKNQKMEGVEFLPLGDVEGDDENDDARNGEKGLEEVHIES